MQVFSDAEVARCLALAREVGADHRLYDSHVHLTDVFDKDTPPIETLSSDPVLAGGFRQPCGFREPLLREQDSLPPSMRREVSRMLFKEAYRHPSPLVLRQQMELAGISAVLALPVLHPEGDLDTQMRYLARCCDFLPDAILGYSAPVSEETDLPELVSLITRAKALYGVKAIKLHTNISRIDLASDRGRRHANSLIEACGSTGLPLIVHGGASPMLSPEPCCDFGRLERLASLDWHAAPAVIIAHCGIYGCTQNEIETCLPILRNLLSHQRNIFVDTSGLTSEPLELVTRSIGIERMLLGSDALYVPIWKAVVSAVHAFRQAGFSETDALLRVAGENPTRVLGLSTGE